MKRCIVTLLMFLLLGAIMNIAVAWGLVFLPEPTSLETSYGGVFEPEEVVWGFFVSNGGGWLVVNSFRGRREVDIIWSDHEEASSAESVHLTHFGALASDVPSFTGLHTALGEIGWGRRQTEHRIADARGWPMLALWSHWRVPLARTTDKSDWTGQIDGGVVAPVSMWPYPSWPIVFPVRPIWPGFAVNTLFYAAILWLLFAAPLALRRSWRIKRGLCAACAYPVGASDLCTECGKPVKRRAATTMPSND